MRDPYVLVVAAGSARRWASPVVTDLADAPMVGFQPGKHQDLAEDFLRARGVRPRFVFRSNDNATVQAMVAAGLRVAPAPLLAADENDPHGRVVLIAQPGPPRVLGAVLHRDRYPP